MAYCKHCGKPTSNIDYICDACKGQGKEKRSYSKEIKLILIITAILIGVLIYKKISTCAVDDCNNRTVSGSQYCITHKCKLLSCKEEQWFISDYCYNHYKIYDEDAKKNSVSKLSLNISNVSIEHNSVYTSATGTLKNSSSQTVTFVKIKGSFENKYGKTIDTDWTYVVGSEGLAPGESCKWEMLVDKDRDITKCTVTVIDFDVD